MTIEFYTGLRMSVGTENVLFPQVQSCPNEQRFSEKYWKEIDLKINDSQKEY